MIPPFEDKKDKSRQIHYTNASSSDEQKFPFGGPISLKAVTEGEVQKRILDATIQPSL